MEIIREENNTDLKKIIQHASDFDDPDKLVEMFAYQNSLAGRDKENFH